MQPSPNQKGYERSRIEKLPSEVLALTYGTLVASLCRDLVLPATTGIDTYTSIPRTDYAAVNAELEKMGYNIGLRLVEEFLAKSNTGQCGSFRETAEVVSKVGFRMFLNVVPGVRWVEGGGGVAEGKDVRAFGLVFEENPLADFVELPDDGKAQEELWYSNVLCGVVRGALEMVSPLLSC